MSKFNAVLEKERKSLGNTGTIQHNDITSSIASFRGNQNEWHISHGSYSASTDTTEPAEGRVDLSRIPINIKRHLDILMGKLDGLKQVILQKSDELEVGELQELESLIRSQIHKKLAETNKTNVASKTATIETIRKGSKTFRLRQTASGSYWYLYWYDSESKKKQSKSLGKDSQELRNKYNIPPRRPVF